MRKGKAAHNARVWEAQAAGTQPLAEWYQRPLLERTLKVAAMLIPQWLSAIDMRYSEEKASGR